MQILKGFPAAPGIVIGPGYFHHKSVVAPIRERIEDSDFELKKLSGALSQAETEIAELAQRALENVGKKAAAIFNAQEMMLKDPDLIEAVKRLVQNESISAASAFYEVSEGYAERLLKLDDAYLRARAIDIRDITSRVVRILCGESYGNISLVYPMIVFAKELTPSETIRFPREKILGFVTGEGGATSHTAILSKALGIPAIVGLGGLPVSMDQNTVFILDGSSGQLIIDPDQETLLHYQKQKKAQLTSQEEKRLNALSPAVTLDGKQIAIFANIGTLQDAENAVNHGAEGVGLFRTEFSYLEQMGIPDETDLLHVYQKIFDIFGEQPIFVRTLDIGGDKEIPHLNLPQEPNSFLGLRGIRLSLSRPDLFKPQLRAILRAGENADLHLMFPMVASVREILQTRQILDLCMTELKAEGLPYNAKPLIGAMLEVPAAAICADQLAKAVDFFSIGTNDLTQYTMAADRTNASVSNLVSAFQPAVLRLIKQVIDHGHHAGIRVGMCGELAGEPLAIPILLGLGLDEFSINPPAIPQVKEIIRKWDCTQAKALAEQVLDCETAQDVENLVKGFQT